MTESLLSSHCWSYKHQAHNAFVLPPASTYRCKCPVTIVDTNCPPVPISTSRFTLPVGSSFSSQRCLLPVSHVFVDSSRLLCFLIAPPGHRCVRLLSVRAVVYLFCQTYVIVLSWPFTILRLCPVLSIHRPAKSLFLPCHPWLAITCPASHALHSGLCTFCLLD